jgi:hypothetical protein
MQYYVKMTGPHRGSKKIFVEIWKTENVDGVTYDEKISQKRFFRMSSAKKWAESKIMRLIMKNEMKYFFIKDEDIIRKDLL